MRVKNADLFTAFGETKTVGEWAKDNRCAVTGNTLKTRIQMGNHSPETMITKPSRAEGKGRLLGQSEKSLFAWSTQAIECYSVKGCCPHCSMNEYGIAAPVCKMPVVVNKLLECGVYPKYTQ